MHNSHTTQELLNYFDENDTRVREVPYTIDHQLLNVAAEQLDDLEQRSEREVGSRLIGRTPANIDNRGLYYEVRVPAGFDLPQEGETLPTIEGLRAGTWTTLHLYDDRLPVPAAVEYDPDINAVPLVNARFVEFTGAGDGVGDVWSILEEQDIELEFGNTLTFWLDGLYDRSGVIDIRIEGERNPRPAWINERHSDVEILSIPTNGSWQTRFAWKKIDKITVRNLPEGVKLEGWCLPINILMQRDAARPFIHSGYRDRRFPRYWQIENPLHLLTERYFAGNFSGFEYIQSYSTPEPIVDITIEPNTWGMWAASSTKLYYFDRRQSMPDHLDAMALTKEPTYGLTLDYDLDRHGSPRAVIIRPVPYANPGQGVNYRYSVQDPEGEHFVLLPEGALVAYSGSIGWTQDIPKPIRLATIKDGTYVVTLETIDQHGRILGVSALQLSPAMSPAAVFDLSSIAPEIKGLAFDYLQRLWIWTGDHLIPIKPSYNGFVIDFDNRTVYVTEFFEQVRFS
jgi:hypothetical protein